MIFHLLANAIDASSSGGVVTVRGRPTDDGVEVTVIDHGILQTYYVDDYYGRKLGMPPTTGSASNLAFALGTKDLEGLLKGVKNGVLVTSFLGGNSNSTSPRSVKPSLPHSRTKKV